MTDDLDAICAEYIRRLESALSGLAPADREQIVEQISEHIATARASLPRETEASVREILERLGNPEEIAAEATTEGQAPQRRRRVSMLIVGGAGVLVVAVVVLTLVLSSSSPGPSTTTSTIGVVGAPGSMPVPNLVGEQVAKAVQTLSSERFAYTLRYVTSDRPVGIVVAQSPMPRSAVTPGTPIELTVVSTQGSVTVPNVVGESQAEATTALAQVGLGLTVNGPSVNNAPPGEVVAQSPAAGSKAEAGSAVSVTVSAGPASTSAQASSSCVTVSVFGSDGTTSTLPCPDVTEIVPNLIGIYTPTGVGELSKDGLSIAVKNEHSTLVPAGHIVGTFPSAGTKVPARTTVTVVNSQGS